ncbi:Transcriptional regulator [Lachnospiraceae bacterium TWA4]|nr:Transcriptional regulator [Lachnospiraceae bacterium TWA4]
MDIKQLQYFVVSVDMGSFHSASEVLITTQPNVSKVVKSLEDELGMELLTRTRNGVVITPEGETIYRYAIEILKNMKTISDFKYGQDTEKLSISSIPSKLVAKAVAQFYAHSEQQGTTGFQMEFWEDNVEELVTRIHKRKSEIGFVYLSDKNLSAFMNHVRMKGLHFEELGRYPLFLYAGKQNRWSKFPTITEQMLSKIKLVQYNEKHYSLYSHLGHLKEDIIYGAESTEVATTNSDHFVFELLKNTEYCSISSSFIDDSFRDDDIVAIPIEPLKASISFGYIRRSKDELSELSKEFLEYLKKYHLQDESKALINL